MIKKSKAIYQSRNIETTDYFLGLGMMGPFFKPKKLENYLNGLKIKNLKAFSLELMSHAGFLLIYIGNLSHFLRIRF